MSHLITLSSPSLRSDSIDTENAIIYGVSVITSGITARGHDLAVDAVTLTQMHACADEREQVPVKVDHKSGAAAVCGFLSSFRIVGAKLKADWHLLQTHPQTPQILEVAERMPGGVGLSASFLPPDKPEPGKARCQELISVDYVTLPAANPGGLFSARTDDPAARRKAAVAKVARVVGAGALGAVGAAGIAARGVDRVAGLGIRRLQPSPKVRAGIIGAAGALGAVHTIRAVTQGRKRPEYSDPREMSADFAAALRFARQITATAPEQDETAPRVVVIKPARRSLTKRAAIRAAKIGVGAAGGAYVGRKLGAAAGATTGALAGLLFQSKAMQDAARVALNFNAKTKR